MVDTFTDAVEATFLRSEAQQALFSERPKRLEVSKAELPLPQETLTIAIHRNHALEHVTDLTSSWFALWDVQPEFQYGDYGDSLDFDLSHAADLHIVSIDCDRYLAKMDDAEFADWLKGRIEALHHSIDVPILILPVADKQSTYDALETALAGIPGIRTAPVRDIRAQYEEKFFDQRLAAHMVRSAIKAIALDLDNTLYEGVIGEDGMDVILTQDHHALQERLAQLAKDGVMLAVVSKNNLEDAEKLFATRDDFPLKWSHFSAIGVSWEAKSDEISNVLAHLRIAPKDLLFIDDNPGELATVAGALPVRTIHASDAATTLRALDWLPGLWVWSRSETDLIRSQDALANYEREKLAAKPLSDAEYFASLGVTLTVEVDPDHHLNRLFEMSRKTNQFNLNLQRISEADMKRYIESPDHRVVCVALGDRLSDSGIVALLVAKLHGQSIQVLELAVSCRALGRRLDSFMIAAALDAAVHDLAQHKVSFLHQTGPRNTPARKWLSHVATTNLEAAGEAEISLDMLLDPLRQDLPFTIEKR